MDINLIQTAITSIGFPIICCYFLYQYIGKKDSQLDKVMELHKEEMTEMTDAINRNTEVMDRILDYVKKEENE